MTYLEIFTCVINIIFFLLLSKSIINCVIMKYKRKYIYTHLFLLITVGLNMYLWVL